MNLEVLDLKIVQLLLCEFIDYVVSDDNYLLLPRVLT